jgi:hypothetical protein
MRIRHRASAIDPQPAGVAEGFEHLPAGSLDVLSWLVANHVEFVLVGPVARSVRGDQRVSGAVAIVPAPYGRNIERLVRACGAANARLRTGADSPTAQTMPVKLKAAKLLEGGRWPLRLGSHDLDIEGNPHGAPLYQDLLYEAERVKLGPGLELEVADIEWIEFYDHVARTGVAPEIRVIRAVRERATDHQADPAAHSAESAGGPAELAGGAAEPEARAAESATGPAESATGPAEPATSPVSDPADVE